MKEILGGLGDCLYSNMGFVVRTVSNSRRIEMDLLCGSCRTIVIQAVFVLRK